MSKSFIPRHSAKCLKIHFQLCWTERVELLAALSGAIFLKHLDSGWELLWIKEQQVLHSAILAHYQRRGLTWQHSHWLLPYGVHTGWHKSPVAQSCLIFQTQFVYSSRDCSVSLAALALIVKYRLFGLIPTVPVSFVLAHNFFFLSLVQPSIIFSPGNYSRLA